MADKVAFSGIIRNVSTRIDSSGDKIGRVVVEFRPEGNIIADMDSLHRPDSEIYIVLMAVSSIPSDNTGKNCNEISKRTSPKRRPAQGGEV